MGKRENLEAVQAPVSNNQNTGVLSTLFFSQIQSTAPFRLL